MFLRQSTVQNIRFGPFNDSTDGVAAETSLTITQADMQISKDGGGFAQKNSAGNATHDTDGWYSTTLDATDTNTIGEFYFQVVVAGALPVWVRYYVLEESVYDNYYASGASGSPTATQIRAEIDSNSTQLAAILADTNELQTDDVPSLIAALNNISSADVTTALQAIRLDELMSASLSSQPATGSLLGDLTEDDSGTQRFTTNALENAPTGGGGGGSSDWSTSEREQIRQALGITGTKSATSGGNLDSILSDTETDGVAISTATAQAIADEILKRDFAAVSGEAARSMLNALRFLRNRWSISGTTLTVTEEDDITAAWTATVSTDANANPVTGNDPT